MLLSKNKNFMFFAVPKTGTTFAKNHFKKHIKDAEDISDVQHGKHCSQIHQHSGIIDVFYLMDEQKYNNTFKVAFTRNPFDRVVSWFSYLTQKLDGVSQRERHKKFYGDSYLTGDFSDFVLNAPDWCFSNSVSFMINRFGHIELDYIGKCENYTDDLNYICEKIEIPFIKIKSERENASHHKHYTEYYNDKTRKVVEQRMKLDLDYFNYKF
jgi:hypothetical protein